MLVSMMGNEQSFTMDNFFLIDSNNLEFVKPRLYGFIILNDILYINSKEFNYDVPNSSYGSYIIVTKKKDFIRVVQDYSGSYGLYLFKQGDYFALSNSFLYLVNYLSNNNSLSFNYDYAKAFLGPPVSSLVFKETMVKEIQMLPKNAFVDITISTKEMSINSFDQSSHNIRLDSKEAIDIIDQWHQKWNSFFNFIIGDNVQHRFRLSGGKDSRVVLSCFCAPLLNFDNVNIFTATDNLSTHKDDFDISTEISKIYNFKINGNNPVKKRYKMDPLENLRLSLLVKCGFNKEIIPTHFWNCDMLFDINGAGGDLRELWSEEPSQFINTIVRNTRYNSIDCAESLRKLLLLSKSQIDDLFNVSDGTANFYYYIHGRGRNHNGKAMVESFLSNQVNLSPLLDPVLYQIDQNICQETDHDLLYATIISRFSPEMCDVGFDSGRTIIKEDWIKAKQINEMFPLNTSPAVCKISIIEERTSPEKTTSKLTPMDYFNSIYRSQDLKYFVTSTYGEEIYDRANKYYSSKTYRPYLAASALVQEYIINKLLTRERSLFSNIYNNIEYENNRPLCYNNNGLFKEILDFLQSVRIDIKNMGASSNDISVIDYSDEGLYISKPNWITTSSGSGLVLQSYAGYLDVCLKVVGTGQIEVKTIGPWLKDEIRNEPLKIKVDITRLQVFINDRILLDSNEQITVYSGHPYILHFNADDQTSIHLHIEWIPYIYDKSQIMKLIDSMYDYNVSDYRFWKQR